MINVAYVAVAPFISGSERCLQLILTNCQSAGISPILITPDNSPLKRWAQKNNIIHYSCSLSPLDKKKPWPWFKAQCQLIKILIKHKINIVHSNQIWSYSALVFATNRLKIKRVCHFRDPINSGSRWWLKGSLDAAICISKHIRNEYDVIFPLGHARKVHTLIDPVSFHDALTDEERKRRKSIAKSSLNINDEIFSFGFIGQIAPVKGVLELIELLAQLPQGSWQLVIAGKDPSEDQAYIKACRYKIKSLNIIESVHFIGFVDDTRDFYHAVDCVAMFSQEEPLGLIPLEAAVNYTPTVAANVGGLPETIIDGKTGWLVDVQEQEQTVNLLGSIMSEHLFDIGTAARAWVESVSLPEVHCQQLKLIYQKK